MSETTLHADDIRNAGCAYLELIANDEEDTWETVDVANGTVTFILNSVRDLHLQQADDLLFFVRKAALAISRRNRLIVRRKGRAMPHDCAPGGEFADAIDWPRSALLNMVLQTPYSLSVSACRRSDLPHVLRHGNTKPSVTQVSKPVYASPTRVDVNLDSSRTGSAEPDVTYPQICFAVDNFDSAFDSLVLRGDDHCYSVCLWGQPPFGPNEHREADDKAQCPRGSTGGEGLAGSPSDSAAGALISPDATEAAAVDDPLDAAGLTERLANTHLDPPAAAPAAATHVATASAMVLLFAGYVSYSQLQAVVDTTGLHPLRLWLKGGDAQHHVLMKGPGGVGHADVAVTVCSPREEGPTYRADQGPAPPAVQLKRALFTSAAKLANAVGGREGDAAVRCALMTLTLPVDHVARALFGMTREGGQ